MFYLTAGVIAGTGSGFGYVVPTSVGSKWFPDKRGLVIGLMVGGYGAGSGVFGPLASSLIERVGWRSTFQILSLIFLVMTMVGCVPFAESADRLSARGLGGDPSKSARHRAGGAPMLQASERWCGRETFWALWVAYYAPARRPGRGHKSAPCRLRGDAGHSTAVAAFAPTVGAIGSASGRILSEVDLRSRRAV